MTNEDIKYYHENEDFFYRRLRDCKNGELLVKEKNLVVKDYLLGKEME